MPQTADVVIVGGGIIGCSVAYFLLRRDPTLAVIVLERDVMVGTGATAKATGGIRHQFSSEPNIRLTLLSLPWYLRFEEETGCSARFLPHGYLFVTADPAKLDDFRCNVALQQVLGVPSRLVLPEEIAALMPGIRTDDLVGGTFCDADGSAEPAAAVQGFAAAARARGAQFHFQQEVVTIAKSGDRVRGVRTQSEAIAAGVVVIAAGAYSADVARLAGVEVPSRPFRRQVTVAAPVSELDRNFPLTIDSETGFYIHRTGRTELLLAGTDADVRPGCTLDVDWNVLERMLTAAVRRIPILAHVQIQRSYVGLRGLTPDHNPILGRVREVDGLVVACGDNGHGFMHAPATGLLLAEEVLDGQATTLDLAPFRLERFTALLQPEANIF